MTNEELAKYLRDLQTLMLSKIETVNKIQSEIDMTVLLLESVAERTENYREYFFSRKMIDAERRNSHIEMNMDLSNPEDCFNAIDAVVVGLGIILEAAKKEVRRLDR